MADLITVEDPDDPRLRDYTGLTDVELRRRREPAEGLFIAEGEKVIRRAKDAGYEMRSMLLSPDCADPLYRRSVKVSMGAVFSVPYARLRRPWNEPSRPVRPWTTSRVSRSTTIATTSPP